MGNESYYHIQLSILYMEAYRETIHSIGEVGDNGEVYEHMIGHKQA